MKLNHQKSKNSFPFHITHTFHIIAIMLNSIEYASTPQKI